MVQLNIFFLFYEFIMVLKLHYLIHCLLKYIDAGSEGRRIIYF